MAPVLNRGSNTFDRTAFAAGVTGLLVFGIGFVVSFFLPEPKVVEEKV
jgi:hypothetical protein